MDAHRAPYSLETAPPADDDPDIFGWESLSIRTLTEVTVRVLLQMRARIVKDAAYCHKCGDILFQEPTITGSELRKPALSQSRDEDQHLVEELLAIDPKPSNCHSCGKTQSLSRYPFALGKPVSTQREWGTTALSVAFSVVTIPLLGVGGVRLPGKSTRLRILRLTLVLCSQCLKNNKGCEIHPWWTIARKHGYTEFLSADDVSRLH
jgi:hypothetical protein